MVGAVAEKNLMILAGTQAAYVNIAVLQACFQQLHPVCLPQIHFAVSSIHRGNQLVSKIKRLTKLLQHR